MGLSLYFSFFGVWQTGHIKRSIILALLQIDCKLHADGVIRSFVLLQCTFVYDWASATFVSLPRMPDDLPAQVSSCKKALLLINQGIPECDYLLRSP